MASSVGFYLRFYLAVFRGLSRDAKLLVLAGGVNSIPFGVTSVALPIYLSRLGYTPLVIGLYFSIQGAVAVLLTIPFGIVADRFGRKRMVILGGLFASLAFFLLTLSSVEAIVYAAAGFAGLAGSLAFAPLQALLADTTTDENRTGVFAVSFFLQSTLTSVGSLAASVPDLLFRGGWDANAAYTPLLVGASLALLAGPIVLTRVTLHDVPKAARGGLLPRRSGSMIGRYFVSNMIIGLGAGLIVPIFSLWFLLKFGQTETFMGPLVAASSVVNGVAFLVSPVLARRYGMVRTVVALQAGATVILLGMAVIPSLPVAAVLYLARNAAMNMSSPVSSSFLMGAVAPEERSSASAVVGFSFRLPFAVSTAFGADMMRTSNDGPLFITTTLYAIGTAAFYVFFRRVPEKRAGLVPQEAQRE